MHAERADTELAAKVSGQDRKLTLEEQMVVFEEWALWVFYLSCCPLEY